MSDAATTWADLTAHLRQVELLGGLEQLLDWDLQTLMPPAGGTLRSEQSALVSRLGHRALVDPRVGAWLADLEAADALDAVQRAGVRVIRRAFDRATRVSDELVARLAHTRSDAFPAWVRAKEDSDFSVLQPHLERLVALTRERAEAIDPHRHPYDVLLEDSDPGTTVEQLRDTLERVRRGLSELLEALAAARPVAPLLGRWDLASQLNANREVAAALGYDFEAGRIDFAEHPFTVGLGSGDVRITTHLYEDDLLGGLGSTIHEAGHGMYEQGLPANRPGSFVGTAPSLGLHESQSRLWENFIGRSRPFCRWVARVLARHLGGSAPDAEALYRASNRVEPGAVRVMADEVTYNLHVIVRFELELALFEGRLGVADLPEAWNALYQEYLGILPPDDARGVLQDVHWASGAFGYFPSYTLGNLYAASLGAAMVAEIPDLWEQVEAGRFDAALGWLREKVHSHGYLLEAPDLVREAVGERDSVADLLDHLWARQGTLYGLERKHSPQDAATSR